jgi:hypothetical protein
MRRRVGGERGELYIRLVRQGGGFGKACCIGRRLGAAESDSLLLYSITGT